MSPALHVVEATPKNASFTVQLKIINFMLNCEVDSARDFLEQKQTKVDSATENQITQESLFRQRRQ